MEISSKLFVGFFVSGFIIIMLTLIIGGATEWSYKCTIAVVAGSAMIGVAALPVYETYVEYKENKQRQKDKKETERLDDLEKKSGIVFHRDD